MVESYVELAKVVGGAIAAADETYSRLVAVRGGEIELAL